VDSANVAHANPPKDSVAEPVHPDTAHSDSKPAQPPVTHTGARDSATVVKPAATHTTAPDSAKPSAAVVVAPNAAGIAPRDGLVPVRIGRIFAAMPPRDAARVMEQMDDTDVRRILSALSEKQAAAILALMPAPRAAAISKATLKSANPSGESHP
jgi:hypothetical protein